MTSEYQRSWDGPKKYLRVYIGDDLDAVIPADIGDDPLDIILLKGP